METAIYARVSTEEQANEGFSIRAQEQKLKDYAGVKDWSIYKIYIDEGISGKNLTARPAMQEMINDIKNGDVKNVLVFKIDRLTRSTADLVYLIDLFSENNCAFNSLTESIDTQTASGRMFLKIIGIFAEFERENIIDRVKVGIERKVNEGYSIGSLSSFGYDRPKNQKIQTINEDEAEIVREIFDMYVNQGASIKSIARMLNLRKIPTKNDLTWRGTSVRRLLTNVNYIGNVRHHTHDEELMNSIEGLHEPIISKEQFDLAQSLLGKNKKAMPRKEPREDNYFSGLLVCGKCGGRMTTHNVYKTRKDGTQSVCGSYYCERKNVRACETSSISHKKLERAFEEYINKIADLDIDTEIQIQTEKKIARIAQIEAYQGKLSQLVGKEREALKLYVANDIGFDNYRDIKRLVDKEKSEINAELTQLNETEDEQVIEKFDIINNIKENWSLLSANERRKFLLKFMDKIVLLNEKNKGEHLGTPKILDVSFTSIYSKDRDVSDKTESRVVGVPR